MYQIFATILYGVFALLNNNDSSPLYDSWDSIPADKTCLRILAFGNHSAEYPESLAKLDPNSCVVFHKMGLHEIAMFTTPNDAASNPWDFVVAMQYRSQECFSDPHCANHLSVSYAQLIQQKQLNTNVILLPHPQNIETYQTLQNLAQNDPSVYAISTINATMLYG